MKKLILSLYFIVCMVMCGGLTAQNNDTKVEKSIENPPSLENLDCKDAHKWTNAFERFVGVWSLERVLVDVDGNEKCVYPGTFMIVHADAAYTIFVHTDIGAIITSQGVIIVDSPDVFIEVIAQHVNNSLVGISNRIEYKLEQDCNYLHKSFWIEKDKHGDDFKRQVNEIWKRASMPQIIF